MSFNVQSSLFGSKQAGRFGNQFFQLLFFHILSENFNFNIKLPEWDNQFIFENHYFDKPLENNTIYNLESIYKRSDDLEVIVNLITPLLKQSPNVFDIVASFQYNTDKLYQFRNILFDKFIFSNSALKIQKEFINFKKNTNLISIHWREGDYNNFNNSHPYFWKPDINKLLSEIKKLVEISGKETNLYLASDSPDFVMNFLQNENITVLTSKNFTNNENEFLIWDFIALVECDLLVASNSTFSIAASLLNNKAKIYSRSTSPTSEFCSFLPWRTQILINQFNLI
jgi:hypothetical protein